MPPFGILANHKIKCAIIHWKK